MNLLSKIFIFKSVIFCLFIILFTACKSTKPAVRKETTAPKSQNVSQYEKQLGFKPPHDFNKKLYDFIIEWLGTPYKYGGCTKSGTDCSCFVFNVYKEVFNKTLPRSTSAIASDCKTIKQNQLRQGDLIFFNTDGKKVSHIGLHLHADKFVHASTKKGVMISSMEEDYFKKTFKNYGSYF